MQRTWSLYHHSLIISLFLLTDYTTVCFFFLLSRVTCSPSMLRVGIQQSDLFQVPPFSSEWALADSQEQLLSWKVREQRCFPKGINACLRTTSTFFFFFVFQPCSIVASHMRMCPVTHLLICLKTPECCLLYCGTSYLYIIHQLNYNLFISYLFNQKNTVTCSLLTFSYLCVRLPQNLSELRFDGFSLLRTPLATTDQNLQSEVSSELFTPVFIFSLLTAPPIHMRGWSSCNAEWRGLTIKT